MAIVRSINSPCIHTMCSLAYQRLPNSTNPFLGETQLIQLGIRTGLTRRSVLGGPILRRRRKLLLGSTVRTADNQAQHIGRHVGVVSLVSASRLVTAVGAVRIWLMCREIGRVPHSPEDIQGEYWGGVEKRAEVGVVQEEEPGGEGELYEGSTEAVTAAAGGVCIIDWNVLIDQLDSLEEVLHKGDWLVSQLHRANLAVEVVLESIERELSHGLHAEEVADSIDLNAGQELRLTVWTQVGDIAGPCVNVLDQPVDLLRLEVGDLHSSRLGLLAHLISITQSQRISHAVKYITLKLPLRALSNQMLREQRMFLCRFHVLSLHVTLTSAKRPDSRSLAPFPVSSVPSKLINHQIKCTSYPMREIGSPSCPLLMSGSVQYPLMRLLQFLIDLRSCHEQLVDVTTELDSTWCGDGIFVVPRTGFRYDSDWLLTEPNQSCSFCCLVKCQCLNELHIDGKEVLVTSRISQNSYTCQNE
jgi:hypothetical protein